MRKQFTVYGLQFTMSFQFSVFNESKQRKLKIENITKTENRKPKTGTYYV